ncbi:MAG: EAL domain-containing protein [Pseudomonadota bacterium]|nr:EAL domain-containing protein [Pseudomonadota bacterium]
MGSSADTLRMLEREGFLVDLIERALFGVYLIQNGCFSYVNPRLADIFGYSGPDEIIGMRVEDLVVPEDRSLVENNIERRVDGETDCLHYEFRGLRADGSSCHVEVRGHKTRLAGQSGVFGTLVDNTERRAHEARIRHLAFFDPLTGFPNRRLLQEQAPQDIALAKRQQRPLALLYLDLNRFKYINDTWGHTVGDQLLMQVARRFRRCVRASDTVARLGGDEFVFLLPDTDEDRAETVVRRILHALEQPIEAAGHKLRVSASIGVVSFPGHGDHLDDLMKHADIAMYKAKLSGQVFAHFELADAERLRSRVEMERELEKAIDNGQLELHYQPRVELTTGRIASVEALVRWRHPDRGLIPPGEFIELAEESGSIFRLGDWVMREAARQIKIWRQAGHDIRVAINLSAKELNRGDLVERIESMLAQTHVPATWLEVEITETMAMDDIRAQGQLLGRLKELGILISIDDFGTGYSSLKYIHDLPVDALKIDRSFVSQINTPRDNGIVEVVITLARKLGLTTVAEGVERVDQVLALEQMGCEQAQGFLFSRPAPADQMSKVLAEGGLRAVVKASDNRKVI